MLKKLAGKLQKAELKSFEEKFRKIVLSFNGFFLHFSMFNMSLDLRKRKRPREKQNKQERKKLKVKNREIIITVVMSAIFC